MLVVGYDPKVWIKASFRQRHSIHSHWARVAFTVFYILYFLMLQSPWNHFFFKSIHWLSRVTPLRVVSSNRAKVRRNGYIWEQLGLLLRIQFVWFSSWRVTLLELLSIFENSGTHVLILKMFIVGLKLVEVALRVECLVSNNVSGIATLHKASSKLRASDKCWLVAMGLNNWGLIESQLDHVHPNSQFLLLFLNIELF